MGLATPLSYLCSGVVLNIISQLITDTSFSAPEAHIIPAVKFTATLVGAALRRPRGVRPAATPSQRRLMAAIGLLDASAYTLYCLGFFACGATLANLLLSGVGQVLTAALTRWVLRRRLTGGQLAGIAFVGLGLAVRAAPAFLLGAAAPNDGGAAAGAALSREQLVGAALVGLAALLYSILGVAYEKLLKGEPAPPPNAEIMWHVSILGFLASAAYQALYTLPNWDRLVAQRMAASGTSPRYLVALLALFGALFNLHMLVQAAVFKTEGAIGVGLVNAVRGAVITVTVAALFCSPARPHLCLTPQTILSAAITTVGGAVYVLAGSGQQPPQPAKAAAHGAAAEDKKDK
ncbi:hypothetical protein CHLNCDRAFT_52094 [Chlorella variabilis]|uniref:Sugar phosphate transporter domain-containing protein n=1 Tax=Chlorella variabilis TaxID=554065 RepID=E1ZED5_CHLVA|nr:hypothetical protein CHLNCDRAFT_52094 [Chlorella variabilis]EFN56011.1 hypothetical protein CHLNCDRAFT_52094 [Chlorella variabilis]|eukprot:XP_005848113.1 hypothetical protein CHLNCDRAFT_52094 [Chlorella variabilis]